MPERASQPLLVLDPDTPQPPSEQIAEQLRLQIAAGNLRAELDRQFAALRG